MVKGYLIAGNQTLAGSGKKSPGTEVAKLYPE
jgi:hypothetical protein